jgi:AraC-like DNA-binding protein
MQGLFRKVEITDPHQASRLIWENLPPQARGLLNEREASSRQYEALDRRRFRLEPESYRSQFSFTPFGAMRASRVADSRATQVTFRTPGVDAYCVSLVERGASRLVQPGWREPVVANAETGVIFDSELRTGYAASDDSVRLVLWISGQRLRDRLAVLLDGQNVRSLAFQPVFDQTRGAGATILHMLEFLFAELTRSDSLLANEIAIRAFEDNLALYLLLGLPHSHTGRLQQQRASAAPGTVKRAEEFMRANAGTPLTIAQIAQVAGCSVRALQAAFQHFRRTTPMAALRRIRLEEARAEILRAGRAETIARIAAGHGFGTPSRFAQLFRRTYGVHPSEVLRTQRGRRVSVERS